MLKFFRKKHVAKIIFWGLVILILPAFVLWGTGSIGRSKEKGPSFVGTIDKHRVSFNELFENMAGMRAILILNYFNQPKVLDAFLSDKVLLARLAWDRLIMVSEARKYKMKIPDRDLISYIRSHPLFLRDDKFDEKLYNYILNYNMGLPLRTFEEILRGNLEIQKVNDLLTKDIKIKDDDEILAEYRKENDKFKISYILIENKDFVDKVTIDENKIRAYYGKHKNEFALPAREGEGALRFANFDDVKASIKSYLAENEAKVFSAKYAEDVHAKVLDLTENKKMAFTAASSKLGVKILESPFFSKSDYIEGLGEASPIADKIPALKADQISSPLGTRKGFLIFKVLESKGIDEEKFNKEKEGFAKKLLAKKKADIIDKWFAGISLNTSLNMDLKDVEKYYR